MANLEEKPNIFPGLTAEEASARARSGQINRIPRGSSQTVGEIFFKNIFTYFNLIFAVLAFLVILVGSYRSLTFLPVVIANTVIGIVQQLHAKKILDKLALLARSSYTARRDGADLSVPVDELVLDDVITLKGGQQIPADGVVLDGTLSVNEALLTGEADEIEKTPGSELRSGSFVISGQALVRLTAVGSASYAARLTAEAKAIKEKPSEMVRGIDLIVKFSGIAIIPIGLLLLGEALFINHLPLEQGVVSMVGALVGMIPEGLYLLVTIALTLSAARLAMKKVLLHDTRSTEALARVDVLCVDKTGTITDNSMSVAEVFGEGSDSAADLLAHYLATVPDEGPTADALRARFTPTEPLNALRVQPFRSSTKYSEVETADALYRLGAPEFVLPAQRLAQLRPLLEERAARGLRVMVFARGDEPLLFVALKNGIRPGAEAIFRYLTEQEVGIKVISGDHPLTVSTIAQSVGIPHAEAYVDAATLTSDELIREAAGKYTVFGRVKPEQKKALILAMKASGQKVAMTGDGVNDILAMKEADCSIAMGNGSDAARQAAQVVLLDSDFSRMVDIIGEGRRDINNITRSATLFLYKNFFSLLLALFAIVTLKAYPLLPAQVSLISGFNIGIPAFLLALEPNTKKQSGRFLAGIITRALPAAITAFAVLAVLVSVAPALGLNSADVGTMGTYLLSFAGFLILARISAPISKYRMGVLGISLLGVIVCCAVLPWLFSITALSWRAVGLTAAFAAAEVLLMICLTALAKRITARTASGR